MYITDTVTGETRLYGTDHHDSLAKSDDGRCLYYENLQCGEGSEFGTFLFTDEEGTIPGENEILLKHGADDYFNIGGFGEIHMSQIEEIKAEIKEVGYDKDEYGDIRGDVLRVWQVLEIIDKHIGKGQDV